MKTMTLTIAVFLTFILPLKAQINPISNLTWDAYYISPYNYFELSWNSPALPHDELIGYNVYRDNDLYRFQTENTLYNFEQSSNCDEDFLMYNNGLGFYAHVTAVYNPGSVESGYTETIFVEGAAMNVNANNNHRTLIYPNPTNGVINIINKDFNSISIYNISGKKLKEFPKTNKIDLSDVSKGIYFIKLISDNEIIINKFILE